MSPTTSRTTSPRLRASLTALALLLGSACSETDEATTSLALLTHSLEAEQRPQELVSHVYYRDRADLNALVSEYDSLEKVDRKEGFVALLLTPENAVALQERGYRVEINEAATRAVNAPRPALDERTLGIPAFSCYRTVEETYADLAQLAAAHSDIAEWVDIGNSWDKVTRLGPPGYDLFALVLTNKSIPGPKPRFFLMAAIHAREYTTAETATRFAEQLVNGYNVDPDITWMLDHSEVHIVTHSNPDGRKIAEQGYLQRKNRNPGTASQTCSNPPTSSSQYGVDLNRNSTFGWGGSGSSSSPCTQTYRGTGPASEPETMALESYIRSLFPDRRGPNRGDAAPDDTAGVMITLHSYSELVLFPWGDSSSPVPNLAGLRALGKRMSFFNNYEACQVSTCLYEAAGGTDDYAYGELGVASYTIEMGNDFFESCSAFESDVLPRNLPALMYAFKVARRPYQLSHGPDSRLLTLTPSTVIQGTPSRLRATADDTRFGAIGGAEPSHPITAARYSVDQPSWVPGTPVFSMGAVDGVFSSTVEALIANVNTNGLAPGRHTIFVESRDASGAWGPPSALFLTVQLPTRAVGVTPDSTGTQGLRGQLVTYTLSATNQGNMPDSFQVSVDAAWRTWAPVSVGPLAVGESTSFQVTVLVPTNVPLWASDTAQVHVASLGDSLKAATASIVTTAMSNNLPAPASVDGSDDTTW
ncbi:M14 family zinc carboxypeptidase [Hyalangium sp.]|uniref:M14 family zinc carboxypeptidase n=1 Tax=Hyalangium sp. TaxID=2028555 RepID=UPI002D52DF10|nr:M14 family zinc carboxypeptidase [Hyalangium sp.]HYI03059.1 M14 family zinc carboxypeptidase [Hyalangium sp.]